MKKLSLIIVSAIAAISLSNCGTPTGPNTQKGAIIGGLGGAAAGAIIGKQSENTFEGALLGGAAGAGAGALIGNNQDKTRSGY